MKRNLFLKTLLATVIINSLIACAAFQPAKIPLPPLRVEYTQWWGDYTLLVALEKGYFEEYNVDVEPVYYEIFTESFPDLAAGQIDAALIASGDVMSINRHAAVKIIGLSDDGGYMSIVAQPEIKSIRDLEGKNVGILTGTQYELLVLEMLNSVEMNASDINVQNINPEDIPNALSKNEILAGFTWEPFTSQAIKNGAHIIYPVNDTLRLFPDTIAFRQNVIDQRPEDIKAFMKAWFKAVDYRATHTEETRQIAAKYLGIPVDQIEPDPSLQIFTYQDNLLMYSQYSATTNSIFSIAQKTADYLISSGTLAIMPNLESIITPNFLP